MQYNANQAKSHLKHELGNPSTSNISLAIYNFSVSISLTY